MFSHEQDSKTLTHVCEARALLAQLPAGSLSEETQIDMIYGLLSYRIRNRLPRSDAKNFTNLLDLARVIEDSLAEETKTCAPQTKEQNVKPDLGASIAKRSVT